MFEVYKGYVTFAPYSMVLTHIVEQCCMTRDRKRFVPEGHEHHYELWREEKRLMREISNIENLTGLHANWQEPDPSPFTRAPKANHKGIRYHV